MRKRKCVRNGVAVTGFTLSSLAGVVVGAPEPKVELCHVPPGNPAAAHTIVVSKKAAQRHLENHRGDYLGACVPDCRITDCPFVASTRTELPVVVTDAFFGMTVSLTDSLLGVASLWDDHAGPESGAAYIFRQEGGSWVLEAKLTASDAAPHDAFGSISVSDDRAVVGAPAFGPGSRPAGAAYVYVRDGTSWMEEAKLTVTDVQQPNDGFANSVSISGSRLVVGARFDYHDDHDSGAAYVFHREGSEWIREKKLVSDGEGSDDFGFSVSMDGDYAAVGAVCDDVDGVPGFCVGSVYVFRWEGGEWLQQAKLSASDAGDRDYFGISLHLNGDLLIVGANRASGMGTGRAYIFRRSGDRWQEEARLLPDIDTSGGSFGDSVAIDVNTALVGGVFAGGRPYGVHNGAVYVFQRDNGEWRETSKLFAADASDGDLFGVSAAMHGNTAAAGAVVADGISGPGGVHIFDLCNLACTP